ncbi:hypothetical protein [Mesorhizobium sp. J428]|uniref:hypothetical protein n=1 Tax=Mesorhizobium sp. J428 TaxID=2898440 RepID=UPI00215187F0|nr:hypothetical protein [Mesorhizobium sp. J428]MCR5859753.1 hypothetical protein [Mesorhizobium sp. J428]
MFISRDVRHFLDVSNGVHQSFGRAAGRATAKIDTFASGGHVVFGMDPGNKSPSTLVARNGPVQKGIVDLRVISYQPDVRIFGAFAEIDTLVLLTWAPKTGLHYATEIKKCRSVWDAFFTGFEPHKGESHGDYISRNVIPG